MVKFESVLKNSNDSINKNGIIFKLLENCVNYVYSSNLSNLKDIVNIATGFNKPSIGSIIYDEYNIDSFSYKEKSYFIRNYISIITPFVVEDLNTTIYEFLKIQCYCLGIKKSNIDIKINNILEKFDILIFRKIKIKELSNEMMLTLFFVIIHLNDAKYIFFYGIEKYIVSKESKKYFYYLVNKYINLSKVTFTIFVTQKFDNSEINLILNSEKNKINNNFIDVDKIENLNDSLLIRTKKINIENNKLFLYNWFFLFFKTFKNNLINILICIFMFLFLGAINGISIFFESLDNVSDALIYIFLIFSIALNLVFGFVFPIFLYGKIKNRIYEFTRRGFNVVEMGWILIIFIFVISSFYFLIGLSFILISFFVLKANINWNFSLIVLFILTLVPIITFIGSFVFSWKKMFKKMDDIV